MKRLLTTALLSIVVSSSYAAERTIVPVFGIGVKSASGIWYSSFHVRNVESAPNAVRIARTFPLDVGGCSSPVPFPLGTLEPFGKASAGVPGGVPCFGFQLGAFEVESDGAIEIDVFAFRLPADGRVQLVEVARDWMQPNRRATIYDAFGPSPANLFLINPNDHAIRVDYWTDLGGSGTALVPANATSRLSFDAEFPCPGGCGGGSSPVGQGIDLHLRSGFTYLAALSSPAGMLVRVSRVSE